MGQPIAPPKLQKKVLSALHEAHFRVVQMKVHTMNYVWWSQLDQEIEEWVLRCQLCQESCPDPPLTPIQAWESSLSLWSRLHLDFTGLFQRQTFLVVVSYSKWLEVVPMSTTSS